MKEKKNSTKKKPTTEKKEKEDYNSSSDVESVDSYTTSEYESEVDEDDIDEVDEDDNEETEFQEDEEKVKKKSSSKTSQSNCLYDYVANNEEDDVIDENIDDEEDNDVTNTIVPKEERITKPILDKYEMVRIIGNRSAQLASQAKVLLKDSDGLSNHEQAKQELLNGTLPFILKRPRPDGKIEVWHLNELEINKKLLN